MGDRAAWESGRFRPGGSGTNCSPDMRELEETISPISPISGVCGNTPVRAVRGECNTDGSGVCGVWCTRFSAPTECSE